jgi:uncharacterized membrane protein
MRLFAESGMIVAMTRLRLRLPDSLRDLTTDPAVRVGILEAAWSVAPAYSRGLLPRAARQQAVVGAVTASTHYVIGATGWAAISSIYAGAPGHRAGQRALLAGAAVTGTVGYVGERLLRPYSGSSLVGASAWTVSRYMSTLGLAGGIVTASDAVASRALGRTPSLGVTLAMDVAGGAAMGAGSLVRRHLRIRKYGLVEPDRPAVERPRNAKSYLTIAGLAVGTSLGIAGLAIGEQASVRAITAMANKAAGVDLGEAGVLMAHAATAGVVAAAGGVGLNAVRRRTQRGNEVTEAAYPSPPVSLHVSCGPNSEVNFDDIGKEGRRFVLMTLASHQIEQVMAEPAIDPVRIVIPRQGSVPERVALTLSEMEALGAFERSIIVIASPTGVGYVNYVMAEALEYLTRGSCATVVPQYALVPSALALDTTDEGTELQAAILEAIKDRLVNIPPAERPRLVQFGESLGAQVALDIAAEGGVHRLDTMHVEAGLYLGVPFRSKAWHILQRAPKAIDPDGRIVEATQPSEAPTRAGMHLMLIHDDDPVNKFSYTMFVRRPWWMGPPEERPPMVPREVLFRPVVSFVIALVDLLNGMDSKPGEFHRVGHDYRIDMRGSLEKAFLLRSSPEQAERIEAALREREQMWAQTRLVATTAARAVATIQQTLKQWGQDAMVADEPDGDGVRLPLAAQRLLKSVSDGQTKGRMDSSGGN